MGKHERRPPYYFKKRSSQIWTQFYSLIYFGAGLDGLESDDNASITKIIIVEIKQFDKSQLSCQSMLLDIIRVPQRVLCRILLSRIGYTATCPKRLWRICTCAKERLSSDQRGKLNRITSEIKRPKEMGKKREVLLTSGSFFLKTTCSLASSVFSQTIFPSREASTTPPELHWKV